MDKRKTQVTIDELTDLLMEIDNGAGLSVSKGSAGYDLSEGVTLLVAHLIEGFLFRHKNMGESDG